MSAMSDIHIAAQEFIKGAMEEHYGDDAMEVLTSVMLDADDAFEAWLAEEYGGGIWKSDVTGHSLVSEVFRDVAHEALGLGRIIRGDIGGPK